MERVEVDGLGIAYHRAGAGPPLVLLHGYVGDGPTTWRRQLEGFCDQFTVVAWDAPGAGGSADPPASFGLAGFLQRLGLEQPHLAGLSLGGILALELYRRHPAIPSTLILASAYAGWGGSLPAEVAQQRLQQAMGLAELSPEEFVGALLPTMFSQATLLEAFRASMLGLHPAGFRAMARASAENLREVLSHIGVPTLLVYGDKDVRAPLTVAEDLHAAIPARRWSSCPTPGICTTSKLQKRSTRQSEAFSATGAADHRVHPAPGSQASSAPANADRGDPRS
jgi:pimeloyl-ACP methyl ester carboxylesterase